jgi:hypothetical protein
MPETLNLVAIFVTPGFSLGRANQPNGKIGQIFIVFLQFLA